MIQIGTDSQPSWTSIQPITLRIFSQGRKVRTDVRKQRSIIERTDSCTANFTAINLCFWLDLLLSKNICLLIIFFFSVPFRICSFQISCSASVLQFWHIFILCPSENIRLRLSPTSCCFVFIIDLILAPPSLCSIKIYCSNFAVRGTFEKALEKEKTR